MKKNSPFVTGIGIWASGILVGASVVDLFPNGSPSWSPGVRLAIGLLIGIVGLAGLYKASHPSSAR
jgi:hypothetical protein